MLSELRARRPRELEGEVPFHELGALADPVILGLPECRNWGLALEPQDEMGRQWLQFSVLGIRVPVLSPRNTGVAVLNPMMLTGPDLVDVEIEATTDFVSKH